jgi:hypothetical protein
MSMDMLDRRLSQLGEFAETHTGLLPANVDSAFLARLRDEAPRLMQHNGFVLDQLAADDDYVALCHWNANVDNAWFWAEPDGVLRCGLMDWGCVSVMNVAMALWGSLCSAETEIWERHLDGLLDHFAAEFHTAGGPALDTARLRTQLLLYAAVMGVAWLLDAPAHLTAALPDQDIDRFDPRIADNEPVWAQLLMLGNVLHLWETQDFGALLDEFEYR